MTQSLQALSAYGRAFDVVVLGSAALAGLIAIAAAIWLIAPPRYERWRRRRHQRRYVQAGLRQLEHYLTDAATTPARRRPGPRGPGRWPGSER
jgi:hypothetical protein